MFETGAVCVGDPTVPDIVDDPLGEPPIDPAGLEPPVDQSAFELPVLPADWLDADDCLSALAAAEQQIAMLYARQSRVIARFAELRREHPLRPTSEFAADELAAALSWPRWQATRRLADAEALTSRLPATMAALDVGAIDQPTAEGLCRTTVQVADPAVVHAVEQRALGPNPETLTSGQVRARARRAVAELDPHHADRHARATMQRRVTLVPQDDGMAGLWALLPAEDAVAIRDRLTALARDAGDDARTVDQRRADAFVDLLLGTPAQREVRVNLTVPIDTALGGNSPAELAGYGPIDADTARRLAADATWRRILTDEATGTVVDVGRTTYRPPAALADLVAARDQRCVFPGCTYPAESCDLDHTVSWQDGGSTSAANLGALCRHHHRLKHEQAWQLEQSAPGHFRWTSPTGRRYTTGSAPPRGRPSAGHPTRPESDP
ncbi:DUF222 domain-containing protein [Actinocatenispora sera]|uniref:HNH endonuclease signature motif containing protein n=1 Tax=Actinocatenispora sera TaxID=390989 RepID=UPI0033D61A79